MESDKLKDVKTTLDESYKPYYTDIFTPGEIKEQLEIGKEVKGGLKHSYKYGTYGLATGNVAITGVGFRPTSFRLHSVFDGGTQSDGYADGTIQKCIYIDGTNRSRITNNEVVRIYDNVGNVAQIGSLTSFDGDGITINFSNAASVADYVLECFG